MRILEVGLGHRESMSKVAYGRAGRQLIALAGDRFIVWSLETFEQVQVVARASMAMWLDCLFIPGGKAYLEVNGYWKAGDDLPNPRTQGLRHYHEHIFTLDDLTGFLCFANDGRSFLCETYGQPWQSPQRIALWDFAGACVRTFPEAGASSPNHAAFASDGMVLALGGGGSYTTTLWDAVSGAPIIELKHTDCVFALAFSPDGTLLATSAGRTVRLWSVPDGKCLHKFRSFLAYTECVAFSPDGTMLVAGSREGRVRIWEAESGRELCDHNWQQGDVADVAFSPDGLTAAAACRKQAVVVWDVDF
jgi:WD40 repeat protein